MNIHEHQAKEILKNFGVPTSNGIVIYSKNQIDQKIDNFDADLYVVKAQIHAGGRGKAGGVKLAKTKEQAKQLANEMWAKTLVTHQTGAEGQQVSRIYIESGCDIKHEYYLSMVVDRSKNCLSIIGCEEGGVDIEEVAEKSPEKIITTSVDIASGISDFHCRKIAFSLNFPKDVLNQVMSLIKGVYKAFVEKDADQIEINPLVLTTDGRIIALDAKMTFDDNGLFKHKDVQEMKDKSQEDELENKASDVGLSYVKMDGSIGCMVNGAGLAMATMDIIKLYGAEPANFLDVGGGADKEKVKEAFKIILSDSSVKGILVNIFGGIMRCDIIADGIVAAAKEINLHVPLVVRLSGTNFELGKKILASSGLQIITADDLADAAKKVVEHTK